MQAAKVRLEQQRMLERVTKLALPSGLGVGHRRWSGTEWEIFLMDVAPAGRAVALRRVETVSAVSIQS